MRIRTIKPEFWQSEDLAEVSDKAKLLAIGLLNMADDEGYLKCHAALIKSQIFPFIEGSLNIHGMLVELSNASYITLLKGSDGKDYLLVNNFNKHQKVNRPTPSKIRSALEFTEQSLSDHKQLTVGKEGKGKEGKGRERNDLSTGVDLVNKIFDFWVIQMGKQTGSTKLTTKRSKAIQARLKDGYTEDQIKSAIVGCSLDPFSMGQNDRQKPFNDIELICRTGEKLESFLQGNVKQSSLGASAERTVNMLQGLELE